MVIVIVIAILGCRPDIDAINFAFDMGKLTTTQSECDEQGTKERMFFHGYRVGSLQKRVIPGMILAAGLLIVR